MIFDKIDRKKTLKPILVKISVAALIIIAIGFGWHLYSVQPLPTITINEVQIANLETRYNANINPKAILLPDKSFVLLAPNSKIQYLKHFNNDKRVVLLEGSATFQVSKDAKRPFTVKSYGISTTALGTRFKVVAPNGSSKQSVILYEGKVVVFAKEHTDRCYYLLPGYSLTYNKLTDNFHVDSTLLKPALQSTSMNATTLKMPKADLPTGSRELNEDTRFENVPLSEVITYLSAKYHTKIKYDTATIEQINFVGTIHKNDSLSKILQDMALINHLQLEDGKSDFGYYLKNN